jgi:hypothetical protein
VSEKELLLAIVDEIILAIEGILERGEELVPELEGLLLQTAEYIGTRLQEIDLEESQSQQPAEQQAPPTPPTAPPAPPSNTSIPQGADLLWILAGGDEGAFRSYLTNIPDPELNALSARPDQVQQIIARLRQQITLPAGEAENGIAKANLNSSNVYGFRYDPRSGRMRVRFNSGSVYEYDNVPPRIFKLFQQGAAQAQTTGQNRWGAWWRGKSPSLGAAMHQYIRDRFNYRRLS